MVLPISDVNATRGRAFVLWLLVLGNAAVFGYQTLWLEGCEQLAFVYRWAAIPSEVLSGVALTADEAATTLGSCPLPDEPKQLWVPLVTSLFLHGNLAHLLGNLIFLVVFGNNLEARLGHLRFLGFYVTGGIVATLAFVVLQAGATTPLVGASGAIAAILGAYAVCFPRARIHAIAPFPLYLLALVIPGVRIRRWLVVIAVVSLPAWLMLGGWFVGQALALREALGTMVAYEAHVAGFLAGIVMVLVVDRGRTRRAQPTFHPRAR